MQSKEIRLSPAIQGIQQVARYGAWYDPVDHDSDVTHHNSAADRTDHGSSARCEVDAVQVVIGKRSIRIGNQVGCVTGICNIEGDIQVQGWVVEIQGETGTANRIQRAIVGRHLGCQYIERGVKVEQRRSGCTDVTVGVGGSHHIGVGSSIGI